MITSGLRNLRVFSDEGEPRGSAVELPTTSQRYQVVRIVLDRALLLLESGRGRTALFRVVKRFIQRRWTEGKSCCYDPRDTTLALLPGFIDDSLRHMRKGLPDVLLTITRGEALAERWGWSKRRVDWAGDHMPQNTGDIRLRLNRMMINEMIDTESNTEYDVFLIQMAVSVAHEIGNLLTSYLSGSGRRLSQSPFQARAMPELDHGCGEGWYWECAAIGGIPEFYGDTRHRTNPHRLRIPYIFDDTHRTPRDYRRCTGCVAPRGHIALPPVTDGPILDCSCFRPTRYSVRYEKRPERNIIRLKPRRIEERPILTTRVNGNATSILEPGMRTRTRRVRFSIQ